METGGAVDESSENSRKNIRETIRALSFSEHIRIAVAADDAFCFTYPDNLELLEEMGAELIGFSPVRDQSLPPDVSGLILSGGYPELHAEALGRNCAMREAVRKAVESGMPCIAECGGFCICTGSWKAGMADLIPWRAFWMQRRTARRSFPVLDISRWKQERTSFWEKPVQRSGDMSFTTGTVKAAEGVSAPGSRQAGGSGTACTGPGLCMQAFRISFYYSCLQVPHDFLAACFAYRQSKDLQPWRNESCYM